MEGPFPSSSSFVDHYYPMSNNCSLITELLDEKSSSLGFMELLNTQDVIGTSIFDVLEASKPSVEPLIHPADQDLKPRVRQPSEVFNAPATPNTSSISSESNGHEQTKEEEEGDEEEEGGGGGEENRKIKKMLKPKKTYQKRQREPRFAFMTKSDVDQLEDGYRWRKYGQKAVKNSPFPRSYYRCTNSSCNVKKMVERSSNDPSIVVTTYEGQHTHPSPHLPRPIATVGPPPPYSGFSTDGAATLPSPPEMALLSHNQHHFFNYSVLLNSCGYNIGSTNTMAQPPRFCPKSSSPSALPTDHGLLQDVVPRTGIKEEEQ